MPSSQKVLWIGLGITALAILVLGYFLLRTPPAKKAAPLPPDTAALAIPDPPPAPAETGDPAIAPLDLDLDRSDEEVRRLVAGKIPPALSRWLQEKDILRTLVGAVDLVARGESPAPLLRFLTPRGSFLAAERNGRVLLDPRSFSRYDPLSEAFLAVPDSSWVMWVRTLQPTLEKAFAELGYPGMTFARRTQQAIAQLLAAPSLGEDVHLETRILSYAFADPDLERLNPAQKHLLRLGPRNSRRIQEKLRRLAPQLPAFGGE